MPKTARFISPVVSIQYRLVTDRRTHDDSRYRASVASRGKNVAVFLCCQPGFKEAEGGLYVSLVFLKYIFSDFFRNNCLNIHQTDLSEICRDGRTLAVDK